MNSTRQALGRWPKAPLALALAQVRFEPILDIDAVALQLQERIAKDYPRVVQEQGMFMVQDEQSTKLTNPVVNSYQFVNADESKSVRLDAGSLTYTVSEYQQYHDHFEAEWLHLLVMLGEVKSIFVNRLGLRYLDCIVPQPGVSLDKYVNPPIGRFLELDDLASGSLCIYEYAHATGNQRIQFVRGVGRPNLPPELQNISLKPSVAMQVETAGDSALLDIDRISNGPGFMSIDELRQSFAVLHSDLTNAFHKIVSQRARDEWMSLDGETK